MDIETIEKIKINSRLEELREYIRGENISYAEMAELQGLAEYIDKGDIELLDWAYAGRE